MDGYVFSLIVLLSVVAFALGYTRAELMHHKPKKEKEEKPEPAPVYNVTSMSR